MGNACCYAKKKYPGEVRFDQNEGSDSVTNNINNHHNTNNIYINLIQNNNISSGVIKNKIGLNKVSNIYLNHKDKNKNEENNIIRKNTIKSKKSSMSRLDIINQDAPNANTLIISDSLVNQYNKMNSEVSHIKNEKNGNNLNTKIRKSVSNKGPLIDHRLENIIDKYKIDNKENNKYNNDINVKELEKKNELKNLSNFQLRIYYLINLVRTEPEKYLNLEMKPALEQLKSEGDKLYFVFYKGKNNKNNNIKNNQINNDNNIDKNSNNMYNNNDMNNDEEESLSEYIDKSNYNDGNYYMNNGNSYSNNNSNIYYNEESNDSNNRLISKNNVAYNSNSIRKIKMKMKRNSANDKDIISFDSQNDIYVTNKIYLENGKTPFYDTIRYLEKSSNVGEITWNNDLLINFSDYFSNTFEENDANDFYDYLSIKENISKILIIHRKKLMHKYENCYYLLHFYEDPGICIIFDLIDEKNNFLKRAQITSSKYSYFAVSVFGNKNKFLAISCLA